MRIKLHEYDDLFWMILEPTTKKEIGQLLRLSNTAKRQPINFRTAFGNDIYCEFPIYKKDSSHYNNAIENNK